MPPVTWLAVRPWSARLSISGDTPAIGRKRRVVRWHTVARNIEIKARVTDMAALMATASGIADKGPIELIQDDTFFHCPGGRLKLRTFSDGQGELIFYRRADEHGPKESFYVRSPTASPGTLREALALGYGVSGRVLKRRTLFLVGRTRIHLDEVEGLGHFAEIEVVLADDENADGGIIEAQHVMAQLGITPSQLIEGAYVDLIAGRS